MNYRKKLVITIAHALGYYMGERLNGNDAVVQLHRYKRLCKELENYDRINKYG